VPDFVYFSSTFCTYNDLGDLRIIYFRRVIFLMLLVKPLSNSYKYIPLLNAEPYATGSGACSHHGGVREWLCQ